MKISNLKIYDYLCRNEKKFIQNSSDFFPKFNIEQVIQEYFPQYINNSLLGENEFREIIIFYIKELSTKQNIIEDEKEIIDENFDWEFYLDIYPDLKKNGIFTEKQAYQHWLRFGKEGEDVV